MKQVEVFTDGACSGNPGPGGWGAVLRYNGREKELSGGERDTTNNRMELTAVIKALEQLKEPCKGLRILCKNAIRPSIILFSTYWELSLLKLNHLMTLY